MTMQHQQVSPRNNEKYREIFTATEYETEHPLVRVHPETERKTFIVRAFLLKVCRYNSTDSRKLFDLFQSHILKLENIVRWRWEADVAIWDNRATQHRAINDYGDQHRVVRQTLEGRYLVGADGQPSKALKQRGKRDISHLNMVKKAWRKFVKYIFYKQYLRFSYKN